MIAVLLVTSLIGCLLLHFAPPHGVREMIAATIAVAPIMGLLVLYVLGHLSQK